MAENTMEIKVTIEYKWENEPKQVVKEYVESIFLNIRNEWANIVNPFYEEWNAEAEKLGLLSDEAPESGYMKFMVNKTQEKTDEFQNYLTVPYFFGLDAKVVITDECDFSLIFKGLMESEWHKITYSLRIVD